MRSVLLALALAGCGPALVDEPWRITAPRVVAVVAEPPEARPGDTVALSVVVLAPGGVVDDAQASWAPCTEPRPLTENGSLSTRCLGTLPAVARGPVASLALDPLACALFGPDTPPGNFRPRDPDATGGYYQPVQVSLEGAVSFAFERLLCNPAGVSNDVARDFASRYPPNHNPVIAGLTARAGGQVVPFAAIPAGSDVTLALQWTPESAEAFPVVDLESLGLAEARETLRVSWFVTAGQLSEARSGGENHWKAPAVPGSGYVWAVLRDSRGGVAFTGARFDVR